jgi:hypothetical protein
MSEFANEEEFGVDNESQTSGAPEQSVGDPGPAADDDADSWDD